jgi:D,D-heptose 1,7-bisphosphate phosphatase
MPNKAIFLDRDNTLIEDPGYINDVDQVKLLRGVPQALKELSQLGYKLVVVSNQSGVARGILTEQVLRQIHDRLRELLAREGALLDQIYYCPYHPEGVIPKYRKDSDWRKPRPGMLLAAAKDMDLDLSRSWLLGDSSRDIEAGSKVGCKTILINRQLYYSQPIPDQPKPDYKCLSLREAVNIIKQYHRTTDRRKPEPPSRSENAAAENLQSAASQAEEISTEVEPDEPQAGAEPYSREAESESARYESLIEQHEPPKSLEDEANTTEELLAAILQQLRAMHRAEMFGEFSVTKLIATVLQTVVLLCLLMSIWLLLAPQRNANSVILALGFAILFQMMSLSFYLMQGRK